MDKVEEIRKVIAEKIPADLVLPEHDETGHKYRHVSTNKVFASVTTKTSILENPRLKRWAANLAVEYIDRNWHIITPQNKDAHYKAATLAHEDELKDAGNIGTQGHGVIERYLKQWIETGARPADIRSFIIGEDARLWAISRSAEKFCIDFDVTPIASELKVASVKHEFAGTLDSLMMVKYEDTHIFCIVDFKTSNSIDKPEYAMQVSAYWQAINEMTRTNPKVARTGLYPEELLILQLDKEKMKYNVVRVCERPKAFMAFHHVCKVYDYINSGVSKIYPYTPKKQVFIN